jgi:signal transduction histidine kinase
MPRRPSLWIVLLIVNGLILSLPLIAIAGLRLYERELVRGTEAQLLTLAAAVRDAFAIAYQAQQRASSGHNESTTLDAKPPNRADPDLEPMPLVPEIDVMSDQLLPPAAEAVPPEGSADPIAVHAGELVAGQVESVASATLAGVRIVDRHGIVVATSGSERGLSIAAREEVQRALQGRRVSLRRERAPTRERGLDPKLSRTGDSRVFVALPVTHSGSVVGAVISSRTTPGVGQALAARRGLLLLGACAVVTAAVAVTLLTNFTIAAPLRRLQQRAQAIAAGQRPGQYQTANWSVREVHDLAESVQRMAVALDQRSNAVRALADQISHEFKGPLSTLHGSLEMLQDHATTMNQTERERFLAISSESVERLERLTRRLLELARADMLTRNPVRVPLEPLMQRIAEAVNLQGARCSVRVEPRDLAAASDPEILTEVLQLLTSNALVHGGPQVQIEIVARRSTRIGPTSQVEILVNDDGPGVSVGNREKLFTPFFTTARDRGGTGLGLAIAQRLVTALGGSLELADAERGASFRVVFAEEP